LTTATGAASIASVGIFQVVTGHLSVIVLMHDDPQAIRRGRLVHPVDVGHRYPHRHQYGRIVADRVEALECGTVDYGLGSRMGLAEKAFEVLDVVVGGEHA